MARRTLILVSAHNVVSGLPRSHAPLLFDRRLERFGVLHHHDGVDYVAPGPTGVDGCGQQAQRGQAAQVVHYLLHRVVGHQQLEGCTVQLPW